MSFKHPVGQKNRMKILNALRFLGEVAPGSLIKHLDEQARNLVESFYESDIPRSELMKLVRKESMTYRAMLGQLKELKKDGYVKHRAHKYSLSTMKWDFLNIAEALGNLSFTEMMSGFKCNNRQTLIENLVLHFGGFMVYVFLISLEPIDQMPKSRFVFESMWRSQQERKIEKARWTKMALPIFLFYYYFQSHLLLFDDSKLFRFRPYLPDTLETPIVADYDISRFEYDKLIETFELSYPEIFESLKKTENKLYALITGSK